MGQLLDQDEADAFDDGDVEASEKIAEQAEDIEEFIGDFEDRSRDLAKINIDRFFEGKNMHYGGEIPVSVLHSSAYLDMVVDTDICTGVDVAYQTMAASGDVENDSSGGNVSDDVRIVVTCLEECHKLNIPKCFAAGITLMYLELCLGIKRPVNPAKRGF